MSSQRFLVDFRILVRQNLRNIRVGNLFTVHGLLVCLKNESVDSAIELLFVLLLSFSERLLNLELRILLAQRVSVPLSGQLSFFGLV